MAAKWYAKAANQGNDSAQYSLGVLYYNGQGVPQDMDQAIAWFQEAAEQGNQNALKVLAKLGF